MRVYLKLTNVENWKIDNREGKSGRTIEKLTSESDFRLGQQQGKNELVSEPVANGLYRFNLWVFIYYQKM